MKLFILVLLIIISLFIETEYLNINFLNKLKDKFNNISLQLPSYSILKVESFSDKVMNNKYPIWIYIPTTNNSRFWKSFQSRKSIQSLESYKQLCIKTIEKNASNINLVNNSNIHEYVINFPFKWNDKRFPDKFKNEYLKYFLLYNYGGIWLKPETILFKNIYKVTKNLDKYEILTYNHNILGSQKKSQKIKLILDKLSETCQSHISSYNFSSTIHIIIQKIEKNNKAYNLDNKITGFTDFNNNKITFKNFISDNNTKLSDDIIFIELPDFEKYVTYKWFSRLSENQILNSKLWFNYLIKSC